MRLAGAAARRLKWGCKGARAEVKGRQRGGRERWMRAWACESDRSGGGTGTEWDAPRTLTRGGSLPAPTRTAATAPRRRRVRPQVAWQLRRAGPRLRWRIYGRQIARWRELGDRLHHPRGECMGPAARNRSVEKSCVQEQYKLALSDHRKLGQYRIIFNTDLNSRITIVGCP